MKRKRPLRCRLGFHDWVLLVFGYKGVMLHGCNRCGCGRTRLMFGSTHIDFTPDATIALTDVLNRGQELDASR